MQFPDDLKYTKDHEWVRIVGDIATIGISDYAQEHLGDIVYLELPQEGEEINPGEPFGVVESVKAVSDLYGPIGGEVTEINDPITGSPETLNEDCYEEGWLIKIRVRDKNEVNKLMNHEEYQAYIKEEQS